MSAAAVLDQQSVSETRISLVDISHERLRYMFANGARVRDDSGTIYVCSVEGYKPDSHFVHVSPLGNLGTRLSLKPASLFLV